MKEKVRSFIENHITEIDKNLFVDVYLNAFDDFGYDDMIEMTKIFLLSGIDVEKDRLTALNYIITMACEDFAGVIDSGGGVSAMPVRDFIEIYLDNRLGYSTDYVRDYISDNIAEYADMVEIVYEYDMDIIKVRGA